MNKKKAWGDRLLKTHIIQDENDTLQPKKLTNLNDAVECAKLITRREENLAVVCQWFSDIDRH